MMITIAPFTIDTGCNCPALLVRREKEKQIKNNHLPITYWGIYLDDRYISYTSSREQAEKTKLWIEKWLKNRLEI